LVLQLDGIILPLRGIMEKQENREETILNIQKTSGIFLIGDVILVS
jgi:hypothetical protein